MTVSGRARVNFQRSMKPHQSDKVARTAGTNTASVKPVRALVAAPSSVGNLPTVVRRRAKTTLAKTAAKTATKTATNTATKTSTKTNLAKSTLAPKTMVMVKRPPPSSKLSANRLARWSRARGVPAKTNLLPMIEEVTLNEWVLVIGAPVLAVAVIACLAFTACIIAAFVLLGKADAFKRDSPALGVAIAFTVLTFFPSFGLTQAAAFIFACVIIHMLGTMKMDSSAFAGKNSK